MVRSHHTPFGLGAGKKRTAYMKIASFTGRKQSLRSQ